MSGAPKRFAAYRVAYSEVPEVAVGSILVDKRWDLHRTWTTFNRDTNEFAEFGGPRIARLCATCRVKFKRVTDLNHEGECSPETPRFMPEDEETQP